MLPLLRPGRRNKLLGVARIMQRVVEYLHQKWSDTIELRGDSHFASHEFMDWAHDKWYVCYLTGLSANSVLLSMVDKQKRRAENDYQKAQKAEDDRYETLKRLGCPNVKHERIVVRRFYKRKADRMSCNSYRANYFRLFLYAAAFVLAHRMKHTAFK